MSNNVDSLEADPGTSPRFQRSAIQARALLSQAVRVGIAAGVFLLATWMVDSFSPTSIWPAFFACNAAALMLFAAGLWAAYRRADWRRRKVEHARLAPPAWLKWLGDMAMAPWAAPKEDEGPERELVEHWSDRIAARGRSIIRRMGAQAVFLAVAAALVLFTAAPNLSRGAAPPSLDRLGYTICGLCLLLAFCLLVMERHFAAADLVEWPDAGSLLLLTRLPVVTLILSVFSLLLATAGYPSCATALAALGCLSMLVALEFMIRAIVAMFSPQTEDREPPLLAESLVAGVLRWPPRPFTALHAELHSRHGIDLRQIWALTFIRKASPSVILLIAVIGWLLSGLNEVPMTGRGIYERFGRPVVVVRPGLHVGLPWPFGRIVAVENGVVHELATSVAADDSGMASADAEGPAPEGANRLWDGTHVSEKSQIIASRSVGKQSFQIVNMDVRFVYRIGLSDGAALDAAYRTADIPALMENTASRVLVHDFAVRTLDDVLGEGRVDMADEIAAAVRADLDRLHSGIEVLAVVIEAIHPPAGAANAYHAVQAAEITAQALVARERGQAAQRANEAQLNASVEQDKATATARESIATSDVARLRFEAERTAYQDAGQNFLTEAYFTQLTAGLGHAKALILDHRIGGGIAPTFDLRSTIPPIDPDVSGNAGVPAVNDKVKP